MEVQYLTNEQTGQLSQLEEYCKNNGIIDRWSEESKRKFFLITLA